MRLSFIWEDLALLQPHPWWVLVITGTAPNKQRQLLSIGRGWFDFPETPQSGRQRRVWAQRWVG